MKMRPVLIALCLILAGIAAGASAQGPIGTNTLLQTDAASGSAPAIRANGGDTNISINVVPKGTGTLLLNGAAIPGVSGGAGVFTTLTVSGLSTFNGGQVVQVGTSGVTHSDGGIPIFVNTTDAPTTGTVLQTLYTFSLPGNSLVNAGDRLRFKYYWLTAANANNKTTTITFGATTIFNSTTAGFNNAFVQVDCDLFVTGLNTQKGICFATTGTTNALINGASANVITTSTTPAETTSGAITINVTATTPTSAGDLTAKEIVIDYYPKP